MFKHPTLYLSCIGIIAAIMLVVKLRHTTPAATPLAEPARAPFAESIGARGIIESVDENVRIAPAVPGLVAKMKVKVGDTVKAGDTLIELDARDVRARIETLRAAVLESEVLLADKKDQWSRIEKLSERKVSSVDEQHRSQFAAQIAQAQLERTKADLHAAEVQLDLLTIKSPRDAAILQVNVREGEYASLNSPEPVILLGQTNILQLRADVDEDNASRVRPNCEAIAFIRGRRDSPIPLKFIRIEPYIVPKKSLTGDSSERVDTRVLQIIFHFDQPQTPVYVGQQLDVFLNVGPVKGPDLSATR